MIVFFSVIAIVISVLAIFINQWVTFFPQLGIGFQYHRRQVQIGIAITMTLLALGIYLTNPSTGQFIILILVLLLTPLSGFNHASRFLLVVDQPHKVSAAEAKWRDESPVIGFTDQREVSCAWLLETLIPHHLINDTVNKNPILVAW